MKKMKFKQEGIEFSIVIGTRNYLEFYVMHKSSSIVKRRRIYKGFSKSNDLDVLHKIAMKLLLHKEYSDLCKIPVQNKLEEYVENNMYRYKKRTYEQFKGIVKRFVYWCDSRKIRSHNITFDQCRKYIIECSSKHKKGTVRNIQLVLKTIFNGLVNEGTCATNPFAKLPKIKHYPESFLYFNSIQIQMIKEYCQVHNAQLLRAAHLIYTCGIRPNELREIQLHDISIEDNLILIHSENSKNGKSARVVMNSQVKAEMSLLQQFPSNYYLFGKYGIPSAKKVSYNFLNDQHRSMLKKLNINGKYALYSWKHTGAIAMVRAGINLKLIQLQLRHSSLDMTNEYLKNLGITDNDDLKIKLPNL